MNSLARREKSLRYRVEDSMGPINSKGKFHAGRETKDLKNLLEKKGITGKKN